MRHYPRGSKATDQIEDAFTYHAPLPDQPERYVALREKAKELAYMIVDHTPSCREQSLALTHLETAIMFANAAIARHEVPIPGGQVELYPPTVKSGEPFADVVDREHARELQSFYPPLANDPPKPPLDPGYERQ